ncbi:MAG: GNAT family N-acetyltransferase [Desulfobacteraceae bacterium]|nr:GNAT family N-acetyltransferase [Desulfobacteraceae bacterium]
MNKEMAIRNVTPMDHARVIAVMPAWWGGRDLTASVQKLFFIHFANTSFIAEARDELVGFLIGFLSQAEEDVGYIHFAGVHPDYRKAGLGRVMFEKFFEVCKAHRRWVVKSCTSPVNKLSIAFHQHMGFAIEAGDGMVDGVPVSMNFLRANDPKVLFRKELK